MTKFLCALLMAFCLTGCAGVKLQDYAAETPKLDLATYFNGKVDGWGMVQDSSGKVLRRSIQAICEGRDPGDLTTIEDPTALMQIKSLVTG